MEIRHTAVRAGRLSSFLKDEMGMSTGLINKLKWQNKIFVNGAPEHNDFPVAVGDVITALLDEPKPEYPAEEGELTVLYEDDHLLAVDKPAGMLIHPSRATMTGTLANRVIAYYQKTGQNCAFHPVTRLDRDTFGIVLLAKNSHIHALLNEQHNNGQLYKTYHALVFGSPSKEAGTIDAPIARREKPSLLRFISQGGKPSVTQYRVLEKMDGCSLLSLCPVTGRTHQLRVHCAHIGCPILGDPQYCTPESQAFSQRMGLSRQALCARTLDLAHPITGAPLHLESKMNVTR